MRKIIEAVNDFPSQMIEKMVVGFPVRGGSVLLGYKQRSLGKGYLVGPGGKVENGETLYDALIREVRTEAGIEVKSARLAGLIQITHPRFSINLFPYVIHDFSGMPCDSDELRDLAWYSDLPCESMFPADGLWVPRVLQNSSVYAKVTYGDCFSVESSRIQVTGGIHAY